MTRAILALGAVMIGACFCGCGGSSSGSGGLETDVQILPSGVFPMNVSTGASNRVSWLNNTTNIQTVTSGVLGMVPASQRRVVKPRILIEPDNTFVPSFVEANFGDTIEWQNNRSGNFQMQIVDQADTVITTLNFAVGEVVQFTAFPRAGTYTYQQSGMPLISGQVRLYGVPTPDGNFVNTLAPNGGVFTRPFPSAGTFNYYAVDASTPSKVFINGRITIQ